MKYGVKIFNSNPLPLTIGEIKLTKFKIFMMVLLSFIFIAFFAFAVMFYMAYPHQMVWLIPAILMAFVI